MAHCLVRTPSQTSALTMPLPRIAGGAIAVAFNRAITPAELADLQGSGADIFELRLDLLDKDIAIEEVEQISASFADAPLIITCRAANEGGCELNDEERLLRYASAINYATAVDIELASTALLDKLRPMLQDRDIELILSYHNLTTTPARALLADIVADCFANEADICKIATTVNNEADIEILLDLLAQEQQPLAVMGMGELELAGTSRVKLAQAGSLFVFAQGPHATATGQPALCWLQNKIRSN